MFVFIEFKIFLCFKKRLHLKLEQFKVTKKLYYRAQKYFFNT